MLDIHLMFHRYRKFIFFLLAVYVLGWGFTEYQSVFLGLILGTAVSLYNLWMMVRKHDQFDKSMEQGRKVKSLGTASRMASAGLVVLICMKFPDYFHLVSAILGLMTIYIVIMIDYAIRYFRM
ncbi:ATP synthase subunit I [Metabacillus fastidiosus]|uniref:ATP synthase subunit I n=1 Tax=Metabacillus fastidiosus TaxID=1458 RepID=UPI003D2A2850